MEVGSEAEEPEVSLRKRTPGTRGEPVCPCLFELSQTLGVAQRLAAVVHLQQQRFAVAVQAAVGAAGHRQVVGGAEAVEAGVAAHLVNGSAQDHLVFALQREDNAARPSVQKPTEELGVGVH